VTRVVEPGCVVSVSVFGLGMVTRFAPSPTGWLHLGHAYAAGVAWQAAREVGGRFLVRLEDIDGTRVREEYVAGIFEDLAWLGMKWEEPVRRQSEHWADYRAALGRLETMGLMYPCFCTRRAIQEEVARMGQAPHGPDGVVYPGTCRALSAAEREDRMGRGEAYALRLDVGRAMAVAGGELRWRDLGRGELVARPEVFGDVVLARKETPTSYHLAVTVDDALQGVTLVTRGEDLLEATHVHRLLQALLDLPVPVWRHHRLILDEQGRRLAKRDEARSLRSLRAAGWEVERVWEAIGLEIGAR
jgi:glutamyl-Q tRNA(Asp) synthetase